jgi:tetratricopeptide (TPR) repeat protein
VEPSRSPDAPPATDADPGLGAGQRVGRFELLRPLGGPAARGSVWAARDTELGREVALKTLRSPAGADGLQPLLREAQAMAQLAHPNVVAVHEVLAQGDRIFLAMELVAGGTLREWLSARPRTPDEVLDAFEHAGRGLSAAHAAGLSHRDFQPEQVLVGDDGRVRVASFGGGAWGAGGAHGASLDVRAFCRSLQQALADARPAAPRRVQTLLAREGFTSMDELLAALAQARARGERARRRLRVGASALAAALVLAGALFALQRHGFPFPAARAHQRRSVAVLAPRNETGRPDAAWLSAALADMLATELAAGEQLRLVPGRSVALAQRDLGEASRPPGASELRRLRESLGADLVVEGAYAAPAGSPLRLELRLYDAGSGALASSLAESGDASRPGELAARAGARLRQALHVAAEVRAEAASGSYPRDPEAERLLAQGVDAVHALDTPRAVALLTRAAGLAPDNARVQAALAEAYEELGDTTRARAAGERAFAAAAALDRETRLRIERIMATPTAGDWRRAVEISRALWAFFPDDVEYGLRLASDLVIAQQLEEVKAVVAQLRKLPPPLGQDPRIDRTEALAAAAANDFPGIRAAAARAAERARARGSRHLLALARGQEGVALRRLGQAEAASAALLEAEALFEQVGDRRGLAGNTIALGSVAADAGDFTLATQRYQRAAALAREVDNAYLEAAALNEVGNLLRRQRRWDESLAAYDRMGELVKRLNRPMVAAVAALARANVLDEKGDLDAAAAGYEAALAIDVTVQGRPFHALASVSFAICELERGNVAQARALAADGVAAAGKDARVASHALYVQALVDVSDGRPEAAEKSAARAVELAAGSRFREEVALAQSVRARALVVLGRIAEASAASAEAAKAMAGSATLIGRAEAGIAAALVQAAQPGQLRGAIEALRAVCDEAAKGGSAGDHLEARLALGELLLRARDASGRAELAALAQDAEARGFHRVARAAKRAAAIK